MRYLLDTNVFIAAMKGVARVRERLSAIPAADLVLSPVVLGELEFGVRKSGHREANARRLAAVAGQFEWVALDAAVAMRYGDLRAAFESKGQPIGANDLWIAEQALALGLTLVTDNFSEFGRIKGLRLENWLREA
jgi:tRNA(fMet)-specific endonuclease VapC